MTKRLRCLGLMATLLGFYPVALHHPLTAKSQTSEIVRVDQDDIGGVVTSAKGPEAGVWVIAVTTGLPTRFAKIVVTDERGRYVLPDLPTASYNIWVRGYGLV